MIDAAAGQDSPRSTGASVHFQALMGCQQGPWQRPGQPATDTPETQSLGSGREAGGEGWLRNVTPLGSSGGVWGLMCPSPSLPHPRLAICAPASLTPALLSVPGGRDTHAQGHSGDGRKRARTAPGTQPPPVGPACPQPPPISWLVTCSHRLTQSLERGWPSLSRVCLRGGNQSDVIWGQ